MSALTEAWEKARSGSGQVVGIVGEAGVGKSRLLLEFRSRLPEDECTYLEGRCLHFGGSMPYLPILDVLKSYFDIQEDDREYIVKKKLNDKILQLGEGFQGVLPPFQDILSLKTEDIAYLTLEPKAKRDRIFEAIRDLLIKESQNSPLVAAVEDLHWIDKTSEEFLDYLVGSLAHTRFLLILLYRPEYTHQWGSKSFYNRIGLDQLTTESSAALVQAILEGGEVVPELRELILDRAAGNPLFMEEVTHSLIENGSIEKKGDRYVLRRDLSDIHVPDTIQGIIAARLDRLEENLKGIMQVASVVGRDFAFRILQTITGMREELKSHLLNLQGLEFIYEKNLFPELEYIFKHALTQEVAYNSLLLKRRKEIHEKIGRAIEELYAERLEEFYEMLAYHYSRSDSPEKAYQYSRLSGEKAWTNYSYKEALDFYKMAISMLNQLPESDENKKEQIHVRLLMSLSMYSMGYPENSLEILQEGERLAKELGDNKSIAYLERHIGSYYGIKGNILLGIRYHENCLQKVDQLHDFELTMDVVTQLCTNYVRAGELFKIKEVASGFLDKLEIKRKDIGLFGMTAVQYSRLCSLYGVSLGWLGFFDEGELFCEKSILTGVEVVGNLVLSGCEWHFGWFYCAKGDGRLVIEHSQKAIQYAEEAKLTWLLGLAYSTLGWGYYLIGNLEKALKNAQQGLGIRKEIDVPMFSSSQNIILGLILLDLGRIESAKNCLERALNLSKANNEQVIEALSWIWLGKVLAKEETSQSDKPEKHIREGIIILERLKLNGFIPQGNLFLGEICASTGRRDAALKYLRKAERMFHEMKLDYWLAMTYKVYSELFKKEGDQSKAIEYLSKAIEILKECRADGWVDKYEKELAAISCK